MKNYFFKKISVILFFVCILPLTNANAQRPIEIVGDMDCNGVYSESCGWGDSGGGGGNYGGYPPGEAPGSGGGAGGGGGIPPMGPDEVIFNDGSKGKAQVNRFSAGCLRESVFLAQVQSFALAQQPMGQVIMESVKDPAYSSEYWVKYSVDHVLHKYDAATKVTTELYMEAHYMYNRATGQANQLKLKNSFEWGCVGIPVKH